WLPLTKDLVRRPFPWLPLMRELSPQVTEGENNNILYSSETGKNPLYFLSLLLPHQREAGVNPSFPITQGRRWYAANPLAPLCKGSWLRRKAETEGLSAFCAILRG
ncbi:MAG: hypothetical protein ACI39E_01810, partial [Acutalibacteraceae bacterium]